jgi:hypothetical protein
MSSLQIRDMPEHVYEALAARAERHRRSLAQQAVSDLARIPEYEARERRLAIIGQLRGAGGRPRRSLDPVRLIREDRDR